MSVLIPESEQFWRWWPNGFGGWVRTFAPLGVVHVWPVDGQWRWVFEGRLGRMEDPQRFADAETAKQVAGRIWSAERERSRRWFEKDLTWALDWSEGPVERV